MTKKKEEEEEEEETKMKSVCRGNKEFDRNKMMVLERND
jgi:hypothetical protein